MERRTIIRLLLVFGIGIPLLIESVTLLGLVSNHLGGDQPTEPTVTATPDGSPTTLTQDTGVGVGEDLLSETSQAETLSTATVTGGSDTWTLTLAVTVENTAERTYRLRLGPVELADGTTVEGTVSTGPVDPGASESIAHQWQFPEGGDPRRLTVQYTNATGATRTTTVTLAPIPVGE